MSKIKVTGLQSVLHCCWHGCAHLRLLVITIFM